MLSLNDASKYISFNDAKNYLSEETRVRMSCFSNLEIKVERKSLLSKNRSIVCKTSLDNIKKIAHHLNKTVTMIDKSHEGFFYKDKDKKIKFLKTGSMSLSKESNKIELQEIAVLLYLDNDLKPLNDYSPSPFLKIKSNTKINDTINFLKNNHDWQESTLASAKLIAHQFPKFKDFELHRDSKLFNFIKKKVQNWPI